ncbi:ATP-binding cassette domain-containing protein [Candidatus Shapirobacteria bacterium]|nr:ATP-binding cassette domain-containing protein [Candidatus Shapirobacteria bacterium]
MLSVKNISKKFGDKTVLDNVSFEIKDKSVTGLLGPNGAGKTTLMRILTGYFGADSGSVTWDMKEVNLKSLLHKSKIGYLPENNPLYGYMLVREYLEYIVKIKGAEDCVMETMRVTTECGLANVYESKIETLSKGYRQRVGLAAALIGNPDLLILDEPTTGLDPKQIIEIRQLIKKLAKQKMVILSTHILPEAAAICSQLLIINSGKIVLDETTSKIKNLEKKFIQLTS